MSALPPVPREIMQLIAFIASLAAGYDAGSQTKSEAVLNLFGKAGFVADTLPPDKKQTN